MPGILILILLFLQLLKMLQFNGHNSKVNKVRNLKYSRQAIAFAVYVIIFEIAFLYICAADAFKSIYTTYRLIVELYNIASFCLFAGLAGCALYKWKSITKRRRILLVLADATGFALIFALRLYPGIYEHIETSCFIWLRTQVSAIMCILSLSIINKRPKRMQ